MPIPDVKTVRLKDPKDFTLIGRAIPQIDIPDKVKGVACFGLDVRLPNIAFAVVAQCPTLDGTLRLKDPKDFTLIGRPIPHLDIPAKVIGTAGFGLDVCQAWCMPQSKILPA